MDEAVLLASCCFGRLHPRHERVRDIHDRLRRRMADVGEGEVRRHVHDHLRRETRARLLRQQRRALATTWLAPAAAAGGAAAGVVPVEVSVVPPVMNWIDSCFM